MSNTAIPPIEESAATGADRTQSRQKIVMIGQIDDEHNRLLKIFHAYRSAGYDVHFVGMDRLRRRPRHYTTSEGLTCDYLLDGWGYSSLPAFFGYFVWIARLFAYMLRVRADLVHVFELDSGLAVAMGTLFNRIPFIYDVQDNFDLRHSFGPLAFVLRMVDRWVVKRSKGIIMPDTIRIVGPFAGYEEKITIIPNCPPDVPPPAIKPERKAAFTVLAVGYLADRRGIRRLLNAI